VLTSARDHHAAVLDAARAKDLIPETLQIAAPALHNNHFQAVMVVQMHVRNRQHFASGAVLKIDQLFRQANPVMVVNQRQRSDHDPILVSLLADQVFPDEVTDRFGAVLIPFSADGPIEAGEEFPLERETCSNQVAHFFFSFLWLSCSINNFPPIHPI
jgi:hypothetical protein